MPAVHAEPKTGIKVNSAGGSATVVSRLMGDEGTTPLRSRRPVLNACVKNNTSSSACSEFLEHRLQAS